MTIQDLKGAVSNRILTRRAARDKLQVEARARFFFWKGIVYDLLVRDSASSYIWPPGPGGSKDAAQRAPGNPLASFLVLKKRFSEIMMPMTRY